MLNATNSFKSGMSPQPTPSHQATHDLSSTLPPQFLVGEQLARVFRRFLEGKGLGAWPIFSRGGGILPRTFEEQLDAMDEEGAKWEPFPPLVPSGEQFNGFGVDENDKPYLRPAGCLVLRHWKVAVARWPWFDPQEFRFTAYYAYAAATVEAFDALARHVEGLNRPEWQIIGGSRSRESIPRGEFKSWEHLTLPATIRQRLESDVGGFFTAECRELYKRLELPYKRGVLLWGPPGNGKTSIIRTIAALRPDVAALLLEPGTRFDDDDLRVTVEIWRKQAPAVLVIEDLDSLLGPNKASVSTFLNLLDGVDQPRGGGLMLIATTNHPEKLDPAINNRPGRFDVVVEVPKPTRAMRIEYIHRHFPELDEPTHGRLASQTEGLSFAHLQEIRLRSGYVALGNGRTDRIVQDVIDAAATLTTSNQTAQGGFKPITEGSFGFAVNQVN